MSETNIKKTNTTKRKQDENKSLKFEDNLRRLENITSILEKGETDLEESIAYFREGSTLF
jgi:exonuclease VII small subunit